VFDLSAAQAPLDAKVLGPNGRIVFAQRTGGGSPALVIANADGSDEQTVLVGAPPDTFALPVWSPDRGRLLISNLDLPNDRFRPGIVEPDGSNFTIVEAPEAPFDMTYCSVWNGDGSRLLCSIDSGVPGHPQSGVASIRVSDGGGFHRLTRNPFGASDVATDISPDGTRFVFLRFRLGGHPFKTYQAAIFVANVDGTGVRRVTPYGLPYRHIEFATAQWSPDGQQIISQTKRGRLFIVHLDGTGVSKIHLQTGSTEYFAFEPDWSPDGSRIVFCMTLNGHENLFTANADGSNVTQITHTPLKFENGPDWGRI
jgi:Tol biopolymer transport system component